MDTFLNDNFENYLINSSTFDENEELFKIIGTRSIKKILF